MMAHWAKNSIFLVEQMKRFILYIHFERFVRFLITKEKSQPGQVSCVCNSSRNKNHPNDLLSHLLSAGQVECA